MSEPNGERWDFSPYTVQHTMLGAILRAPGSQLNHERKIALALMIHAGEQEKYLKEVRADKDFQARTMAKYRSEYAHMLQEVCTSYTGYDLTVHLPRLPVQSSSEQAPSSSVSSYVPDPQSGRPGQERSAGENHPDEQIRNQSLRPEQRADLILRPQTKTKSSSKSICPYCKNTFGNNGGLAQHIPSCKKRFDAMANEAPGSFPPADVGGIPSLPLPTMEGPLQTFGI